MVVADVGRAEEVRRLAERALAEFGRVDVLVNNAAIRPETPFLDMTEEAWHRVIDVDLHGLWGLTKALAREFGPMGITVNAVSPGPIDTTWQDPETDRHIRAMVSRVPLGRLGTPEEIAALCGFLASEEGGFVSGQLIGVNGGAAT